MGSTNPTVASVKAVVCCSGDHRSGAGLGLNLGMPAAAMSHLAAADTSNPVVFVAMDEADFLQVMRSHPTFGKRVARPSH
jgi:hypothetical protein